MPLYVYFCNLNNMCVVNVQILLYYLLINNIINNNILTLCDPSFFRTHNMYKYGKIITSEPSERSSL